MNMLKKLKCTKGNTFLQVLIFLPIIIGIILMGIEISRHTSRQSDLQQMANILASQIESSGRVDSSTNAYFNNLTNTFKMNATYIVEGNVQNGKLELEAPFTVKVTYKDNLRIGIANFKKEKTYVAKAVGIAEKYHK